MNDEMSKYAADKSLIREGKAAKDCLKHQATLIPPVVVLT